MNDRLGIGKESENKIPVGPLALIALPGCEDFAERVDAYLGMWRHDRDVKHPGYKKESYIIDVGLPRFGSGEAKGVLKSSVRGDDLFIMADVTNYNIKYKMYGRENPMSPDDHFQNLKRVIAAAGGKARRITVIMPFLYESRQHRRTSRESLDCAMALEELVYMGVNCIMTLDAHDPRVQNAIPLSGFENVTATYQFIKALLREEKDLQIDAEHMMVISPDEGAVSRAIYFASMMGLDVGMFYKRRDYTKIVNGRNPIVAHEFLGSSVEGKDVIVVDDMIASGDSAIDVARQLKMRKARKVFLCSTFGLFTSGMERFDEAVKAGYIDRIFTTNAIYQSPEILRRPYYSSVDMSKYIALFIDTMNHDLSIEPLLSPVNRIHARLDRYREKQKERNSGAAQ
jgi:ribose-phosphate pyrophosphokinase